MTAMAPVSPLNPNASEFVPKFEFNDTTTAATTNQNEEEINEEYNYELILIGLVKSQVEYHFSDANLEMDNYLLSRMSEDNDYWIPVSTIANLTKIVQLTSDIKIVLKAISTSDLLILNEDQTKVKRPHFIPPKPKQRKDLRRTVFIYGLPPDVKREEVAEFGCDFGNVKSIIFDDETDGPNREVAEIVMARKFSPRPISLSPTNLNNGISMGPVPPISPTGHPIPNPNGVVNDFSHLKTCFVVFESQSQANKLVKTRARSEDGVRALHQYDFNRAIKKVASAKARGVSPLFSPSNLSLSSPGVSSPPMQSLMISSPALIHQNQFNFEPNAAHMQRFSMTPKITRPKTAPHNRRHSSKYYNQSNRRFSHNNGSNHHYQHDNRSQSQSTRYTPPHRSLSSRFSNLIDSDSSQRGHKRSIQYAESARIPKHFSFTQPNDANATMSRFVGRGHNQPRRSSQRIAKGPSIDGKKGFNWSRNKEFSPHSGQKPPSPSPIEANTAQKQLQTSLHFVPLSPNHVESTHAMKDDNSWNNSWDSLSQQSPVKLHTHGQNL